MVNTSTEVLWPTSSPNTSRLSFPRRAWVFNLSSSDLLFLVEVNVLKLILHVIHHIKIEPFHLKLSTGLTWCPQNALLQKRRSRKDTAALPSSIWPILFSLFSLKCFLASALVEQGGDRLITAALCLLQLTWVASRHSAKSLKLVYSYENTCSSVKQVAKAERRMKK